VTGGEKEEQGNQEGNEIWRGGIEESYAAASVLGWYWQCRKGYRGRPTACGGGGGQGDIYNLLITELLSQIVKRIRYQQGKGS